MRAPHLYQALRCFCLGAFHLLSSEVEAGAEIPFAFEQHASGLCEYRPLVRSYVEGRAEKLRRLPDAALALDELRREPAAAIFARAHAGP
ncbi:MAG: hypothetical protein WBB74_08910, partial [Gaiellaceae bacterium]